MEAGNPPLLMAGEGDIANVGVADEQVALKFHTGLRYSLPEAQMPISRRDPQAVLWLLRI